MYVNIVCDKMELVLCNIQFTCVEYCTLTCLVNLILVAFKIYDIDKDGFIGNGELFQVLKTMVGNNLTDKQLQQIVDKTILYADKDGDGKISFDEFCGVRATYMALILCSLWISYSKKVVLNNNCISAQILKYLFSRASHLPTSIY